MSFNALASNLASNCAFAVSGVSFSDPLYLLKALGSQLIVDLNSDVGITLATGVSAWADLSGRGNSVIQATGAAQPAYVANVLNGHPALRYTGTQFLAKTSFSGIGAGDRPRAYVVADFSQTGSFSAAPFALGASASTDTGMYIDHATTNIAGISKLGGSVLSVAQGATTDGPAALYDISINAAFRTLISQGNTLVGTGTSAGSSGLLSAIDRLYVGILENGVTHPFSGDIIRLFVVNPAPTTAQHAAIITYLRALYPSLTLA